MEPGEDGPRVCPGCHSIAFAHSQDQAEDRHALVRFLGGITEVRQVAGDGLLGLGQGVPHVPGPFRICSVKVVHEAAALGLGGAMGLEERRKRVRLLQPRRGGLFDGSPRDPTRPKLKLRQVEMIDKRIDYDFGGNRTGRADFPSTRVAAERPADLSRAPLEPLPILPARDFRDRSFRHRTTPQAPGCAHFRSQPLVGPSDRVAKTPFSISMSYVRWRGRAAGARPPQLLGAARDARWALARSSA
jgi:hypothetical protein